MDLLERYLQSVGKYLAAETGADVLAELRANLLEEIDARAEALGRALTEGELATILQAHGRPMLVAARYLPQRSLIGPALFPVYLFTLRRAAPLVALVYLLARWSALISAGSVGAAAAIVGGSFAQLVPVLVYFWAVVTIVFAILEFVQTQHGAGDGWKTWDPTKLPPFAPGTSGVKEKSLASRIADLVVHVLWMLYVCAIPYRPYLLLGPGAFFLRTLFVGFAPVWNIFFILVLVLLAVQLVMKVLALFRGTDQWRIPLELVTKLLGVSTTTMLAFTRVYFVPTSPAANLQTLAAVNYWIGFSFKIALFFALLDLLVEAWKYGRRVLPSGRLAF